VNKRKKRAKKRKFTKEFKVEAVKLVLDQGMSQSDVSRDLGINPDVISRWVLEYESNQEEAFPGKGRLKPQEKRIQELEQENRRLRMERDILKKATAYFAKLSD
jgi:transposase